MSVLDKYRSKNYEEAIAEKIKTSGKFTIDERIYAIKDNTKSCEIMGRFIPTDDAIPYIPLDTHIIEVAQADGTLKKFRHFCMQSYDGSYCPTCVENKKYFKAKEDGNDKMAKFYTSIRKKTLLMVNFLVMDDSQNPENNGKVFLMPINGLLSDDFMKAVAPTKEQKEKSSYEALNIFNIDKSALVFINFTPKGHKDNNTKYNKWELIFKAGKQEPIAETEEEMERILDSAFSLKKYKEELSGEMDYYGAKFRPNGEVKEWLDKAIAQQIDDDYEDDKEDDYEDHKADLGFNQEEDDDIDTSEVIEPEQKKEVKKEKEVPKEESILTDDDAELLALLD